MVIKIRRKRGILYMRKSLGLAVLLLVIVLLAGCGLKLVDTARQEMIDYNLLQAKAVQAIKTHSPAEIQANLHRLAPIFAKTLAEDQSFKKVLGTEVAKRFDDDYDVLFDVMADKVNTKGEVFSAALAQRGEDVSVQQLADSIPYLNISIPVHFDQWSTYDGPIYVIPLRYDIDDMSIESLPGYDAQGNVKMFDMSTPPDYPVVILGINERIDQMIAQNQKPTIPTIQTMAADDGTLNHDEYLRGIYLVTTNDPWPWSGSEVYALYAVGENEWAIKQPYSNITECTKWYYYNNVIFYYDNTPNHMYWKMELWEEDFDFGSISYSVTGGFNWSNEFFHIKADFSSSAGITAADDSFGNTQVYFYHAPKPGYNYSEICIGDAYIRLSYVETTKP